MDSNYLFLTLFMLPQKCNGLIGNLIKREEGRVIDNMVCPAIISQRCNFE